jgi:arylformamidase
MIRWVSRGFIFVSTNYRLLPEATPVEPAQDIANALAITQARAAAWGGYPASASHRQGGLPLMSTLNCINK